MSIEFTLMCHGLTAEDAKALFNARPGVELQFRDDDWRVSYGFPNGYLDLMYLADFNTEASISAHIAALTEFARTHCAEPGQLDSLIQVIDGSAFDEPMFAMTVLPEPDLEPSDPRMAAIEEWAYELNAIITMPNGIFSPDFSPILAVPELREKPWWRIRNHLKQVPDE